MAVLTADIDSHTAEWCDGAFEAFCDDIAGMFDAEVSCTRQEVGTGTAKDLKKHFKKLAAVHHVEATGALKGKFHLFFDQGGLFTLSGVVVMLPERRIREEIKRGSIDDAENLTDAAREVGNLLVGSWDRVFREECEGHDHFLKTGTFIGKPWEEAGADELSLEGEFAYLVYEMTVDPYPSFTCAAVFPKAVLEAGSAETAEPSEPEAAVAEPAVPPQAATSEAPAPAPAKKPDPVPAAPANDPVPAPAAAEPVETPPPPPPEVVPAPASQTVAESQPVEPSPAVAEEPPAPVAETTGRSEGSSIPEDIRSTVEAVVGPVEEEAVQTPAQSPKSPVRPAESGAGYLDRMFDDIVEYSSDASLEHLLSKPAKDIMVPEVVWSEPEDTVQSVMAKMQQHNTGYVLVGQNGVLEGLVSNSNILGAVSPYLRPMFAKWRRPEDDATLEIKIKWVMSRPVRTVRPDTPLASMIESMRRYGGRCLPVVDNQAKVQGIITAFDLMLCVLEADKAFSWQGKPPQAPPLLI